ncbi:MAG TPA: hypothetical protein VGH29_11095 [Candidatus Binataceae bacterium]
MAAQDLPPDLSATGPACGTEMFVARVTPVVFGGEYEELALSCKTCGHTRKIKIKRS